MTSDQGLITGFVSRFSVVNQFTLKFDFVIESSFTLILHPTGNLGESYFLLRIS